MADGSVSVDISANLAPFTNGLKQADAAAKTFTNAAKSGMGQIVPILERMEAALNQIAVSTNKASAATTQGLAQVEAQAKRTADALEKVRRPPPGGGGAGGGGGNNPFKPLNDNTRQVEANLNNLRFQLNDVATGLASGASPFVVLSQQAGQFTQILGGMGIRGALATLGQAVTGLFTPVNLAIVGFGVAASAAISYFTSADDGADKTNETLKQHAKLIGDLKDRYGDAAQAAAEFIRQSDATLRGRSERSQGSLERQLDRDERELERTLNPSGRFAASGLSAVAPLIAEVRAQLKGGTFDAQKFQEELIAIGDADPDNSRLQEFIDRALSLSDAIVEGRMQLEGMKAILSATTPEVLRIASATEVFNGLLEQGMYNQAAQQAQTMGQALLAAAEAQKALNEEAGKFAAERLQDRGAAYENLNDFYQRQATGNVNAPTEENLAFMRSIKEASDAVQVEMAALQMGAAAAAAYRKEKELLADALSKGIELTDENRQKIHELAQAEGELVSARAFEGISKSAEARIAALNMEAQAFGMTEEAAIRFRAEQELLNQVQRAGIELTPEQAAALSQYANALSDAEVAAKRMKDAHKKMVDEMDAIRDAARDIFQGIADDIRAGADAGEVFLGVLGRIADKLFSMALDNLIVDLFGKQGTGPGGMLGPIIAPYLSGGGAAPAAVSAATTAASTTQAVPVQIMPSPGLSSGIGYGAVPPSAVQPVADAVAQAFTKTGIPLAPVSTSNGLSTLVNADAADNFQGFIKELESRGYSINSLGGYNFRNIAGTSKLSEHAFGNAIDINPATNPMGSSLVTDMPPDISAMAEKWGLSWGGDWRSKKDAMHFEWSGDEGGALGAAQAQVSKMSEAASKATNSLTDLAPAGNKATEVLSSFAANDNVANAAPALMPGAQSPALPAPGAEGVGGGMFGGMFEGLWQGLQGLFSSLSSLLSGLLGGLGGFLKPLLGLFGFASGGYTGSGATSAPAGIVHGQEYVMDAASTARIGVGTLDAMRAGVKGYANGGLVSDMLRGTTQPANMNAPQGTAAPVVKLKNINVFDPKVVGDYLATEEGEQMFMNVARRTGVARA